MDVKIDLHVHTNHSMDGVSSLESLIVAAKQKGLNGFAVTDHNLCREVSAYQEEDFLLIPGCEISTTLGHVVGVFLETPIPVEALWHGQLPSAKEAVEAVHAHGGIAILAHPFAKASKTYQDEDIMRMDCIERYNARASFKNKKANDMAEELATKYGKHQTAGSDAHSNKEIGNAYTNIKTEALTLEAVKKAIMNGHMAPVLVSHTPHLRKGISQFYKAKRSKNLYKIGRSIAYMAYCMYLDCFKK